MAPVSNRHFSQSTNRHYRSNNHFDERSRRDNRYDVRIKKIVIKKLLNINKIRATTNVINNVLRQTRGVNCFNLTLLSSEATLGNSTIPDD